ncbi:MAG: amino acid permease [Nitrososphaerota archaeon]|nr:amino acid permease [Nitrososphaerota archaeon]MDG7041884.1 amino acid permease [Nitrososphaerota archaeon]
MYVKEIGVITATAVGLGAIIGAGIYVLSGTAIALAGDYALVAFLLVGVIAIIIALELGELGSLMPFAKGASYSYTYKAFGSELGFVTGMLQYFSFATSISVVSLGFGSYLSSMIGVPVGDFTIPFAIVLIVVLSLLNIMGIRKAAEADLSLVIIKVGILLIFVAFAISVALSRPVGSFASAFSFSSGGLEGIFAASVVIFFAYTGFQSISTLSGRIKGRGNGAAKAIFYSVVISMILYVLVVVALLLLVPASSYKLSADPLSFALRSSGAPQLLILIIDLGGLIATASATIAMILSSSRIMYQISEDRLLPKVFRKYDKKSDAAVNGIIISAMVGIVTLFAGNIYVIASISNFGLMFAYLLLGFDIMHFRRRGSKPSFRMPLYPYLPVVTTVAMLVLFVGMPKEALLIGIMLVILLIGIYYFFLEAEEKKTVRIKLFK